MTKAKTKKALLHVTRFRFSGVSAGLLHVYVDRCEVWPNGARTPAALYNSLDDACKALRRRFKDDVTFERAKP